MATTTTTTSTRLQKLDKLLEDEVRKRVDDEFKRRVQESLSTAMAVEIRTQVDVQVEEKLATFLERISKKYSIPMQLLLADVPEVGEHGRCRGVKTNGQRCTRNCKKELEGYCQLHYCQKKKVEPVVIQRMSGHTHPDSICFDANCPACNPSGDALRDLNEMLL